MRRDCVVLAKDTILDGSEIGVTRANDNQLIVGISGSGKSTSTFFPTLARMIHCNPIAGYAKPADAYRMARFMESKGYQVDILDVEQPQRGTICFDPLRFVASYEDIEALSSIIVHSSLQKSVDDYWNSKAKPVLSCLIATALMTKKRPSFADVLHLFNQMLIEEEVSGISTGLHSLFRRLEAKTPDCFAVREYRTYCSLPFKTASCVRDTLSAALSTVFPEAIRENLGAKDQINFNAFAEEKRAIFVISNAVDTAHSCYVNLFYRTAIRQLLQIASEQENGSLPRAVRFMFDDFACTTPIEGFEKDISLFRAAGMSAMILLQSETQLEAIYGSAKAAIIRQNCPVYVYYPGGFDDRTCDLVSKRMNLPYEDVLYAPLGKVFVMQTGKKPVHIERYDTLNSKEYQEYCRITRGKAVCQR